MEIRDEIIITYPNVTLEYAECCSDSMKRLGTYAEILSGKLGYRLKVGDEAGFLQSPYLKEERKSPYRKYPLFPSTVVKEITAAGVLFADKWYPDEAAFIPFEDLLVKPVDATRIKFDIRELLDGNAQTCEWCKKKNKYVEYDLFSRHWSRNHRLDSNLKNFVLLNEQVAFF
ncbi:hypothetical protein Desde_3205 [Desulfitobacterium dehalogenans ATCC 51507]|uniref:Uncharacterized protein n=1 Tax=Desulfitobacterium dehalogenans (strain ATCC 51507 / DSM 9161 / JW/IU-DC1) TaxID=756499 RepID=I4AC11_DESDJ|nr:hypothetical protein [Desulfitobacterium dehalogenans]AFM01496.1 hypothetical protein Desde_3205 [Desulfitobacterium dehalogenans ATCC 51507]